MTVRRPFPLGLLLAALALPASGQEPLPPLPVRKDALRPGWFFVGVLPGTPKTAPIVVEIRRSGDTGSPRQYRSPDARAFDLCAMLRGAGLASQAGPLQLKVTRGPGSFSFNITYDGKRCAAAAEAPPAVRAEGPTTLAPLRLGIGAPPPTVAEPVEPPARIAEAPPPTPAAAPAQATAEPRTPEVVRVAAEPVPAPVTARATPEPTEVPAVTEAPRAPAPTEPPAAIAAAEPGPAGERPEAAREAAAPEFTLGPSPESAGPSLSAAQRGLTTGNLEWMRVFLEENEKLKTRDYRVELRFRKPVNIEGIETAAVLKAIAVLGRPKEFLDVGSEHILDPPDDPSATSWVSFSVPESLTIETPRVNHSVFVRIRIGELADAVFENEADRGVLRRKGP